MRDQHIIRKDIVVKRNPTPDRDSGKVSKPKTPGPARERRKARAKAISRRADALEQSFLSASEYCPACL